MATRRRLVLEAMFARVQAITQANGYESDLGMSAVLGFLPQLGPDDPDLVLAVLAGDDMPGHQGMNVVSDFQIVIAAIVKVEVDGSWQRIEDAIGDIKRAIEQPDRTLGGVLGAASMKVQLRRGPTQTLPRQPGSEQGGTAVSYLTQLVDAWGDP